jgi:uncharacterized protein YbjT (DUF2867 family)
MPRNLVTVFGGTGFLGRAVVRQLAASGRAIRIAARHPAVPDRLDVKNDIELCAADIRGDEDVARAVRGATGVVNAVSLYVEQRDGATFEAIHVVGAARVARHTREAGAEHLVHISGIGAAPSSPSKYVAARGRGEERVRDQYREVVILRPSVLFGPGDTFLSTLKSLTLLPAVPLFGAGDTRLQPVHVDDVAMAVAGTMTAPDIRGGIYQLGGARVYTYRDILELMLARLHRRRLLVPVPFGVWKALAGLASILPTPPLTTDQVILMRADNVVGRAARTFSDLGIEPRSLEDALATDLARDS